MTTTISGSLEIDHERGVIYFHADDVAEPELVTTLRICRLPKPIPKDIALDITHMFGTNWGEKVKSNGI